MQAFTRKELRDDMIRGLKRNKSRKEIRSSSKIQGLKLLEVAKQMGRTLCRPLGVIRWSGYNHGCKKRSIHGEWLAAQGISRT
jgi:hypothetical protein